MTINSIMHEVVDWFLHKTISSEVLASVLKATRDLERDFSKKDSREFCHCNLEVNPDQHGALEMCANLLLEWGEVEKAQHCLGCAITVWPNSGFSKYLQL